MNPFHWLSHSLTHAFMGATHKAHHTPTREEEQEKFFDAIEKEDLGEITRIAEKYPKDFLNWKSNDGHSPMRHAQEWNSLQAFVQLGGMGGDRHEDYGNGWTPLTLALSRRHGPFVDYLIGGNAETLNKIATDGEHSYTALHLAVLMGDEDRLLALIERGADTTIKAKPGREEVTSEELAVQRREKNLAEMLHLAPQIIANREEDFRKMAEYSKAHAYVPKPEEPPQSPFRGVTVPKAA